MGELSYDKFCSLMQPKMIWNSLTFLLKLDLSLTRTRAYYVVVSCISLKKEFTGFGFVVEELMV